MSQVHLELQQQFEAMMTDDDQFNMSLRKFLKQVGVTSQQQIERLVREKALTGTLKVRMVLTAEGTDLNHVVDGQIPLG